MDWLIPISALIGIWSFLSVLGSERERRTRDLERQLAKLIAESTPTPPPQNT
ncbi:MAG TPA: hypothetical protein VFE58_01200 [Tepidisphaeraceae bacterium]|nr:hypothetical protein [Tepidisphaeraceae bacterium]